MCIRDRPQALGGDPAVAVTQDRVLDRGEERRDLLGGTRPAVRVAVGVGRHQPVELEQDQVLGPGNRCRERSLPLGEPQRVGILPFGEPDPAHREPFGQEDRQGPAVSPS